MFLTGARISEACALTWADLEFGKRQAIIKQTKAGLSERTAHLPTILIASLASITGPRTGPVFKYASRQSCDRSWRRACVRAGIPVLSFHSCRHGFATELLRKGVTIADVARLGGWRSRTQVLLTYGHAMDDLTLTDRLIDTPTPDKARPA
jgi:integrase